MAGTVATPRLRNAGTVSTEFGQFAGAVAEPVNRNVESGSDIDITKFPAPRMWPLDGGKYFGTGDAVVTKNPDTGKTNLGMYRMMIKSPT